jgi:hypothetical protein
MELLQSSALPLGYVARRRWSGWRESNPRVNLGKVAGYHYITPAPGRVALFALGDMNPRSDSTTFGSGTTSLRPILWVGAKRDCALGDRIARQIKR